MMHKSSQHIQMKLPMQPLKFFPVNLVWCLVSAAGSFGLLTALCGNLAVELWKLGFDWNADGASQKMGPG